MAKFKVRAEISHSITGWCGFSRRTTQGKPRNPLVSANVSQNGFLSDLPSPRKEQTQVLRPPTHPS